MTKPVKWVRPPSFLQSIENELLKPQKSHSKHSCIRWVNSPTSIKQLIYTENFIDYISSNVIFFHNKSPSCAELINNRLRNITRNSELIELNTSNIDNISNFRKDIKSKKSKKTIYIITISNKSKFDKFIMSTKLTDLSLDHTGIWIRGYLEDILSYIPFLFDGMFIFDTSKKEIELIKQRISISDNTIKLLKENQNDFYSNESVLFYWNYEKNKNAPALYINPIILGMGKNLNYLNSINKLNAERNNYFITRDVNMSTYNITNSQTAAIGDHAIAHDNDLEQQVTSQINDLLYTRNDLDSIRSLVKELRQAPPKGIEESIIYEAMARLAKITDKNNDDETQKLAILGWRKWFNNLPETTGAKLLTVASSIVTLTPAAMQLLALTG